MKWVRYVALIAVSSFSSNGHAEIDAQVIAFNCLNCHAKDPFYADSAIPPLKNLSKQQIQQALLDFKYDRKPATLMPRLAKGYSDEELAAVAEYLSRR
jgi:cytochrome c553